jgi:hypothetical protein
MARRLIKMHTQLLAKPYRVALRYIDTSGPKEVVELYRYFSYGDLAVGLLTNLAVEDPAFLSKVSQIDDKRFMASPHKTRRYIADQREHLYINSPHLEKHSRKVQEHWVVTNIGRLEVLAIASAAAAATGAKRLPLSELQF